MLVEMGNAYKQDWYLHLPWVLLSRRVALQPDIGTSSSKLVLGMNPVVPGQLVGAPSPPMPPNQLRGLVKHLEMAADQEAMPMSNHSKSKKNFMPATTETATHVYIKKETPKGLIQSYTGPYPIVSRPSHSTILVKMGTFKSGMENHQLHHWSNAKPANMRDDVIEAEMTRRGRPLKDTSGPQDGQQATEDSVGVKEAVTPPPSEPVSAESKLSPKVNKLSEPTRRSERIRNKNHATSIQTLCIASRGPPPGLEDSVPNFQKPQAWTATVREIQELNKAIAA